MKKIAHLLALAVMASNASAASIDFTTIGNSQSVTNQFSDIAFSLIGGPDLSGTPTTTDVNLTAYAGDIFSNSQFSPCW